MPPMYGVFEATVHQSALDAQQQRNGYRLCTVRNEHGMWDWSNNPGEPGLFECLPLLIQQKIAVLDLSPPRITVKGIGWWNDGHYFLHMSEPEEEWDKNACK